MRKKLVCSSSMAVCFILLSIGACAQGIRWEKSYGDAVKSAKSGGKLIMVDLYTDWCGWCKKLDKDTYTNSRVIALSAKFAPVKVNAEKEGQSIAAKYHVSGYPTILFLDADGKVMHTVVGYQSASDFTQTLERVESSHRDFPILLARLKAKPNDGEAAAKLAVIYSSRNDINRALELLAIAEKDASAASKAALPKTWNAVGDYYQTAEKFDSAVPYFRKAALNGTVLYDKAYAHISIASCFLAQNKLDKAKPELQAVLKMQGAPSDMKEMATQYLAQIKQMGK